MDLIAKYHINDHLDNLRRRFGAQLFSDKSKPLEETVGPLDKDVAPILALRNELRKNERQLAYERSNHTKEYLDSSRNAIMKEMMAGKTLAYMAEWLDVTQTVLRHYINSDHDLRILYQMTRSRRGYIPIDTVHKIFELIDQGYTHKQVADKLGLNVKQVDYQSAKRRKAGLV